MRYFVIRGETRYGPFGLDELKNYQASGNVASDDLLVSEDGSVSTTVRECIQGNAGPVTTAPPVQVPPPANQPVSIQPAGPPYGAAGPSPSPVSPIASTAYSPGYVAGGMQPAVSNHLVMAILSTLFCCLPLGIVAIVFASQVNTKLSVGDIQGAMEASRQARTWSIVSICLGFIGVGLYSGMVLLGSLAGS